jgi:hypothetical protein
VHFTALVGLTASVRVVLPILSALALLCSAGRVTAQEPPPPLITDRPDQTESTAVVKRGVFQLETGMTWTQLDGPRPRTRELTIPGTLLRIGVLERVEARLGFGGWHRMTVTNTPASDLELSGAGDIDVGFKYQIAAGEGRAPSIAFLGSVTLPTGDDEFGAAAAEAAARLSLAHELSERIGLGYNIVVEHSSARTADDDIDRGVGIGYTLSVGIGLSERTGAFIESFGGWPAFNGAAEHSLDGGLTWQVTPTFQLDAAGGVGISPAAPDWFFGLGASVRVPR